MPLFKYVNVTFMIESKITTAELEELLKAYFDGEKEYQTNENNWVVPAIDSVKEEV